MDILRVPADTKLSGRGRSLLKEVPEGGEDIRSPGGSDLDAAKAVENRVSRTPAPSRDSSVRLWRIQVGAMEIFVWERETSHHEGRIV